VHGRLFRLLHGLDPGAHSAYVYKVVYTDLCLLLQHVVTLFEQFSRLVEQSGPVEYAPVRHQVGFQVARIFAGVSLTPKRLEGYLDLARTG
jgi:hypothetical protein